MITKKFRILTLALIFSGCLNISFLVYFVLKEAEVPLVIAKPPKSEAILGNQQILATFSHLTFRELVSYLTNREPVEEGYTKRDLAVAALVAYHHFNLEKALSAPPPQIRRAEIEMFPGLSDEQFEAIIRFAYQEKWPLTSKGLFALLQKKEGDESLEQAFSLTPEFYAVQLLFQKTGTPEETPLLLNLVREGSWDFLERFAKEQAQVLDFTPEKRRSLLLNYISLHSPTAAQLLLKTDFTFALKRLEDRGILDLLSLLKRQTEEGTRFCIELLRSPRSDAIWQAAAMTLYAYVGELPVAPLDPKAVLSRFAPMAPPQSLPEPSRFHTVKDGESLWKISRQYKVKVEEIVKANGLEKDSLFPGMTLKIPQGTGSEPPR
jgi:hypothetical protein